VGLPRAWSPVHCWCHLPALALALLIVAAPLAGQATPPAADRQPAIAPSQALGLRSRIVQNAAAVGDVVLLVPDESTYLQALGLWSPNLRFPVLIETEDSRENIARFIRSFGPGQVLRLAPSKTAAQPISRAHLEQALLAAWDADDVEALRETWQERQHPPLGAVVLHEDDPAWAAGLALAAGRGQILIWSELPRRNVNVVLGSEQLAQLRREIDTGLRDSGYDWAELGDTIDALTVCRNIGGRSPQATDKGTLALTDLLGRHADGSRYAYAGWIFADTPATAAYRAMCALFLHVDSALLFDGYSGSGSWGAYSVDEAAALLAGVDIETRMTGAPGGDFAAWQARTSGGIDADFVHVNTSGNQTDFKLARGTGAWARDVPVLHEPAFVHFIHSWSATSPGDANALAGRWLEQGSFLFVGSVHEPYLSAFRTPTDLVRRLLAGLPVGAAVRRDTSPPWKIQVIGDPLFTVAREGSRRDAADLGLPGEPLTSSLKSSLGTNDLAATLTDLVLLGRDADAAALVKAALGEPKHRRQLQDLLWIGLGALHRAGDRDTFAAAFELLGQPTVAEAESRRWRVARDRLWSKLATPVSSATDADLPLLARHLRWKRPDLDAIRLAEVLAARGQGSQARALLQEVVGETENAQSLRRLQKAIERLGP
jgi:hypothetical protein